MYPGGVRADQDGVGRDGEYLQSSVRCGEGGVYVSVFHVRASLSLDLGLSGETN